MHPSTRVTNVHSCLEADRMSQMLTHFYIFSCGKILQRGKERRDGENRSLAVSK